MLDADEAREYLLSIGIELPAFLLDLLVEQVNTIQPCLAENYSPATSQLIGLYLVGLLGIANADKMLTSQTAPSGASRSFKYGSLENRWNSVLNLLRRLDTANCAGALVPESPIAGAHAGMWVGKGGCMCG